MINLQDLTHSNGGAQAEMRVLRVVERPHSAEHMQQCRSNEGDLRHEVLNETVLADGVRQ
jgi:hypothetical protein